MKTHSSFRLKNMWAAHHGSGITRLEILVTTVVSLVVIALLAPGVARLNRLASAATLSPGVERNWKQFPAIAQVKDAPVIYAIGDMHGDYEKAVKVLVAARLLKSAPARPEEAKWAGGSAVLVCTGDMIDKGPQSVEVVKMMRALQADAPASRGQVIVTLGNHEAEFLGSGGTDKKAADFITELKTQGLDATLVAGGTDEQGLGAWMRGLPAGAKVDDWFFSHAGNTHGQTIEQLKTAIEDGVTKQGFATPVLADDDSILEARMHPVAWWDSAGDNVKTKGIERLRDNAAALDCKHLVAGHQPGEVKFSDKVKRAKGEPYAYEGALFLIDTGMSRGVADGKAAVLKIEAGKKESAGVIDASGEQSLLWERK